MTDDNGQIVRLGLHKRKMGGKVGKHAASNDHHLRQLLERLDAEGDSEAADTIAWLVWWKEFHSTRFYEDMRNVTKRELLPLERINEF